MDRQQWWDSLCPEAQDALARNTSLLQRLKEGSAEFREAAGRGRTEDDAPDADDPNLVGYQADGAHAKARGLPLPTAE